MNIGRKKIYKYMGPIMILSLIFICLYTLSSKTFDSTEYNFENVYKHIKELTSLKYAGRLAGTEGNSMSLKYIEDSLVKYGISPGGENNTYYQNFKSMVPMENSKPYFKVKNKEGTILREYRIGRDYTELLSGFGGNGQTTSTLLYINRGIRSYSKSVLSGKVIVTNLIPSDPDIEYAIDNGVNGILSYSPDTLEKTPVNIENKKGKTILIHLLNSKSFKEVTAFAKKGSIVEIKLDEKFEMTNTPNLIGKIQGKNKDGEYIIISSHIDGMGCESNETLYPGTLDGASSSAVMLEIARIAALQKSKPNKTILFIFWNNEKCGMAGKKYYAQNPLYPLEKSDIIYLNKLGGKNFEYYNIGFSGEISQILRDKIAQFSNNLSPQVPLGSIEPFLKKGTAAISLEEDLSASNLENVINTKKDTIDNISRSHLDIEARFLLEYMKKEVYGDVIGGLLNNVEKGFIYMLIIGLLAIYIINTLNKINPYKKVFNVNLEDICYSTPYKIIEKLIYYLFQIILVFVSVIVVSNIPNNFNISIVNGRLYTNFSWNEVLSKSSKYISALFTDGLGKTNTHYDVMDLVSYSFIRSFKLLFTVIIFALIFGMLKGILDGFKDNKSSNIHTIGTLLFFSIPDVMVVILIQMLFIYLNRSDILGFLDNFKDFKRFLISFLCLVILPSLYITRIASTTVHDEVKKDYIKAVRARGLSNFYIIKNHLLISVFIKVVDSLPSILNLIISNLIVVEFLSYYPGVVYNMMAAYRKGEIAAFTGLALSLSLLYVTFILMFKAISKIINPLKRRA